MQRRRSHAAATAVLALVAGTLAAAASADAGDRRPVHQLAAKATLPAGFRDTTAIGGISQPVTAAFAPDGTAFIGLQTGVIKSFDFNASTGQFEPGATSTDFADLSVEVSNYGDRGLTGITVDPQFGTAGHNYVYVNYTYNKDPGTGAIPSHGDGSAYDDCGIQGSLEARIPSGPTDPDQTYRRGCPVMDRVSRLPATRNALGWVAGGPEQVLVEDGCAQFSSHSSGDVAFGPDGKLYASAGDGASFRNADFGQANDVAYPQGAACPGDPPNEGGSLRAQDQRGTSQGDALGIDGTIFKLDPATGLVPAQATAAQWLVQMGQRNPWRFTFRQGNQQLWSVDVGSSNWEEINVLDDSGQTLANRGWPCYEGTTGQNLVNPQWQPLGKQLCTDLYTAQANDPTTVLPPFFAYRTRTGAGPITPGENCPSDHSSAMSGIAFSALGTNWPSGYQDSLFFSDYLRGCIWRFQKDATGQPDPSRVEVFAQTAGAPTKLLTGPGGDLYYVDYGAFTDAGYVEGSGGIHRVSWVGATKFLVRSAPKKVKVKVDGKRKRTPYHSAYDAGAVVKLVAPKTYVKNGVHYVFSKWKGVTGKKAKRKRKLKLTVDYDPISVKAVYQRVRKH